MGSSDVSIALAPGVSIGDELPPPRASTSQLVVPVPATSQSSAASSLRGRSADVYPRPSASLGNTGLLTQASNDGPTARPSRVLCLGLRYRRARFSSPDDAPFATYGCDFRASKRLRCSALADPAPREPSSSLAVPGPAPPAAASGSWPSLPPLPRVLSRSVPASPRSPKSKWRILPALPGYQEVVHACRGLRYLRSVSEHKFGNAFPLTSASFVFFCSLPVV